MDYLIHPNQCSFISGRHSCDNIILAQEAIHTMRAKKGRRGYVAIKIDMEKAYDRLDWGFIETTMKSLGLTDHFITLIMSCVTSATMRVCWNGSYTEAFAPSRGIRQGDPLSPYLFVLCMERLGQLISKEVEASRWKPLVLNNGVAPISHLFFADDLILFCQASRRKLERVRQVMSYFCRRSGHRVSLSKSKFFVSGNVHFNRSQEFSRILGIEVTSDLGKYLGVPLLHKKVVKATFAPLIAKVRKRLAGWKGKLLSMAGKTVLIKSVLSSLPYYQMQSMLIPKGVLQEIEKISREFFWKNGKRSKKLHLVAWDTIKQDKAQGGLGIKDLVS